MAPENRIKPGSKIWCTVHHEDGSEETFEATVTMSSRGGTTFTARRYDTAKLTTGVYP